MTRGERWAFNLLAVAVAGSGFAYFWMDQFVETNDPFAVVNHPWQPLMLHLHVLASPAFVLIFGVVLNSHIMRKLRTNRPGHRPSGYLSLATFAVMLCSGYMLQVGTSPAVLTTLVAVHVSSSVLFTIAYGTHLLASTALFRRRGAMVPAREGT